jgi:hypothetical protein
MPDDSDGAPRRAPAHLARLPGDHTADTADAAPGDTGDTGDTLRELEALLIGLDERLERFGLRLDAVANTGQDRVAGQVALLRSQLEAAFREVDERYQRMEARLGAMAEGLAGARDELALIRKAAEQAVADIADDG